MTRIESLLFRQTAINLAVLLAVWAAGIFAGQQLIRANEQIIEQILSLRKQQSVTGLEPANLKKLRDEYREIGPYESRIYEILPPKDSFLDIKERIGVIGKTANVLADPKLVSEATNGLNLTIRTKGTLPNLLAFLEKLGSVYVLRMGSLAIESDNVVKNAASEAQAAVTLYTK